MPKNNVIAVAVQEYTARQTSQRVKRLLRVAERQNGDRLAKLPGAGTALRITLDELRVIAPDEARKFAVSIGWGDRITA